MKKTVHSKAWRVLTQELTLMRKKRQLTQQQLADLLDRPQSFIAKIENGERRLDVVEFLIVARALGAKADPIIRKVERALD